MNGHYLLFCLLQDDEFKTWNDLVFGFRFDSFSNVSNVEMLNTNPKPVLSGVEYECGTMTRPHVGLVNTYQAPCNAYFHLRFSL